jgi:hypothetical protein
MHESVVMLMKAGVWIDELSLFERLLWIAKGDGMSAGDGLETGMGRRAGSKSRVRLCVQHHDELICLNRESSAAVRLRATPMGPPQLVQCQSGALAAEVVCAGCGS